MVLYVSVAESVNQAVNRSLHAVIIFIFRYVPYNVSFPVRFPPVCFGLSIEWIGSRPKFRQYTMTLGVEHNTWGVGLRIYLEPSLQSLRSLVDFDLLG